MFNYSPVEDLETKISIISKNILLFCIIGSYLYILFFNEKIIFEL